APVARGDLAFHLFGPLGEAGALFLQPRALARLFAQCPLARAREPGLLAERVARRLGTRDGRRRLGELLDALLEVLAVFDDRFELAVEHAEDRVVLGAQRPAAGGTFPF